MKVKQINKDITGNYLEELLSERGVVDVHRFLNPTRDDIQTWRDLENIEEGIELIVSTIFSSAPYALIVDCDVDGFTSSAIIYQYIKQINPKKEIDYYIHTGKQHGLEDTYQSLEGKGYEVVIIPDASSNDIEYMQMFPEMTFLVLDHHELDREVNFNCILINNQTSPNYRNKFLSGAGVAWQFCRGLDEHYDIQLADKYIDLAALGICSDMMSALEIENQAIWKYGFEQPLNYFFKTLCNKQSFSMGGEITPMTVAFYITPLINAMIRMGSQDEKERMFIAFIDGQRLVPSNKRGEKGVMTEVATESARECTNAKAHQKKTQDAVSEKLEIKIAKHDLLENQILFIRLDDDDVFPSELNGLIAMTLSQKYKRPTIVARLNDEGNIRGSARGLDNSGLTSFKNYLTGTGLFEYAQGHDQAFGISIPAANLEKFHQLANKELKDMNFTERCYDVNFTRRAMEGDIISMISDLYEGRHLWSQGNKEPLIYITDLNITKKDVQVMGSRKDTVKIVKNGVSYMKFFATDMIRELEEYDEVKLSVIGTAHLNYYGGNCTPQIFIQNYEIDDNKFGF